MVEDDCVGVVFMGYNVTRYALFLIRCSLPIVMISSVYDVQRLPSKIARNARGQYRITDTGDESVGSFVFHARGMSRFSCLSFKLSSFITVTQLLRRIGWRIYHRI